MLAHETARADGELSATVGNQEVPIRRAEAVSQPILQSDSFQLSLNSTPVQQASFTNGTYQSMLGQNYDLAYQLKLSDSVTATYDISAGVTQGSTNMLLTSQDWSYNTLGITNKINLAWQPVKVVTLDLFAQGGRTVNDGQSGFGTNQQVGTDASVTVWKDGKMGVNGSVGETTPFSQSLLTQDTGGVTFGQKLPWLPLTLNSASTVTAQDGLIASATDGRAWKNSGSLAWAIQPEATWAFGLDDQQTKYRLDDIAERTTSYYTQLSVQPDPAWTTTFRVSYDTHGKGATDAVVWDQPAVNLSVGVNMKITDTFGAGVVLHYRLPEIPSTTSGVVNDTIFSLTATALF
jgi:hypothetical protein